MGQFLKKTATKIILKKSLVENILQRQIPKPTKIIKKKKKRKTPHLHINFLFYFFLHDTKFSVLIFMNKSYMSQQKKYPKKCFIGIWSICSDMLVWNWDFYHSFFFGGDWEGNFGGIALFHFVFSGRFKMAQFLKKLP